MIDWKLSPVENYVLDFVYDGVEGFLGRGEFKTLYRLARANKEGAIVEIGSWKGKSTIALALGSKFHHGTIITAIDPFGGETVFDDMKPIPTFEKFKHNIEKWKVSSMIAIHASKSADVAKYFDGKIELLFIDGDHKYNAVCEDIDLWYPKVIEGGIIAFHDVDNKNIPGVTRAINEKVRNNESFEILMKIGSLLLTRKVKSHGEKC